jgi:hypothetical protein
MVQGVRMSISTFWLAFRTGWQQLAGQLWPPTPQQEIRDALAELDAELAERYRRLIERQRTIDELRDRLAQQERRMVELNRLLDGAVPPESTPLELAVDLDRVRRAAWRTRERLLAREQGYLRARAAFDRRKQARRDVQSGLLVPQA